MPLLVASAPSGDLFIYAKHLFVAARSPVGATRTLLIEQAAVACYAKGLFNWPKDAGR
jgi:hypothetical protein